MAGRAAVKVGGPDSDAYIVYARLGKKLFVWYTDDPAMAAFYINRLKDFSAEDRYKVIGLDVEFTKSRERKRYVAVLQLCAGDHVLLYHHCRAEGVCDNLSEFLGDKKYTFATVDTGNDKKVLGNTGLEVGNLIDIQQEYKVVETGRKMKSRDSAEDLAKSIICSSYKGLKTEMTPEKMDWLHANWEEDLTLEHIAYAAIDAFISYDMYRRIQTMRECLLPRTLLPYTPEEDALHRKKVAKANLLEGEVNQEPMMNSGHRSEVTELEGRLREILLQEQVNTLQNEKRFKELEDALEKANTGGRLWLYVFLWFISLCFAVFVGCALGAGKNTS